MHAIGIDECVVTHLSLSSSFSYIDGERGEEKKKKESTSVWALPPLKSTFSLLLSHRDSVVEVTSAGDGVECYSLLASSCRQAINLQECERKWRKTRAASQCLLDRMVSKGGVNSKLDTFFLSSKNEWVEFRCC